LKQHLKLKHPDKYNEYVIKSDGNELEDDSEISENSNNSEESSHIMKRKIKVKKDEKED